MSEIPAGIWIIFGGIFLFSTIVTLLDWIGRRQLRKKSGGDQAAPRG